MEFSVNEAKLLKDLFQLCWVTEPHESSRTLSAKSLARLVDGIKRVLIVLKEGPIDVGASDELILGVEEAVGALREDCDVFEQDASRDITRIAGNRRKVDSLLSSASSTSMYWGSLARSLSLSFRREIKRQVEEIETLHGILQTLYDEKIEWTLNIRKLKSVMFSLSSNLLATQPQYLRASEVIQNVARETKHLKDDLASGLHSVDADRCVLIESSKTNIIAGNTPRETIKTFLDKSGETNGDTAFILVSGEHGSGKSHLCDYVQQAASGHAFVIRPRLPLDLLGCSLGETEDTMISLLGAIFSSSEHVLLILDDVEHIVAAHRESQRIFDVHSALPESHVKRRSKATFTMFLDSLKRSNRYPGRNILVLATSTEDLGSLSSRFDRVFYLAPPLTEERRDLVTAALGLDGDYVRGQHLEDALAHVVDMLHGRSYSELLQLLWESVQDWSNSTDNKAEAEGLCTCLKARLTMSMPASLREGELDGFVDMRVMNAQDLNVMAPVAPTCPMVGVSAANAWKSLTASIVFPLCYWNQLRELSGEASSRILAGGVLLSGPSGSGKSAIALQCSRFAVSLLPTMKVIDVSCTSLIRKELGGSEMAIRTLFESARRAGPCIVMLDGIENIAAVRGNDPTSEGTLDRVLSTLLVELDGVEDYRNRDRGGGIAVIGITLDARWVDPALKRPGRLEKTLQLAADWK